MRKLFLTTLITASTLLAGGTELFKPCIQCHGTKAEKVALGKSKILAALSKEEIISTLKGYKDGSYGGPMKAVMLPIVKNLTDDDISTLADHVHTIK